MTAGITDEWGAAVVDLRAPHELPVQREGSQAPAVRGLAAMEDSYSVLLLEHAHDVMIVTDQDFTVIWASPSVTRTLGWRSDELQGTRLSDLAHPDDQAVAVATLHEHASARELRDVDAAIRLRSKRGIYTWTRFHPTPVRGAPTDPPGVVVTLQDIDELVATRQAADATRLELASAQLLIERAPFPTVVATPTGRVLSVNRSLCDQLGCSRGDVVGHLLSDLLKLPGHQPMEIPALQAELGTTIRAQWTGKGRALWVDLSVSQVPDSAGGASRLIAQFVDVSALQEAESGLRRRERALDVSFHESATGLAVTGADGRITGTNPAFRVLLRLDADRVLGSDLAGHVGACPSAAVAASPGEPPGRAHVHHVCLPGFELWLEHRIRSFDESVGGDSSLLHEFIDRTAAQRLVDVLAHVEFIDRVTGLPGRGTVISRLHGWAAAGYAGTDAGYGLVICEVDRILLAGMSHEARISVFSQIGARLRAEVRDCDLVARLDGAHFAVALGFVSPWDLAALAARVGRPKLVNLGGRSGPVRVLIGIAVGEPHEDPRAVLSRAQRDLERANQRRHTSE